MVDSDLVIEELIDSGDYEELEDLYDDDSILVEVINHIKNVKNENTTVVAFVGGAASGKSTITQKFPEVLDNSEVMGINDCLLGDRWFRRPLDKLDPIKKYDPEFLNIKINEICNIKEGMFVRIPTYDLDSGVAISKGEENYDREIGKVDFLIVEGDFDLVENPDYKIYFHVSDDIRMKNRIGRDSKYSNQKDIDELIENFRIRQENQHIKYTLPASRTADMLIVVDHREEGDNLKYSYRIYVKK